jgi:CRISPR-associated protein Cas2
MSRVWVVAYDIDDDGVRRNVFKVLKNFGQRVQFSVFECKLNEAQFDNLRAQLKDLLGPMDSLRCYPLCKWCHASLRRQGMGQPVNDEGFVIS